MNTNTAYSDKGFAGGVRIGGQNPKKVTIPGAAAVGDLPVLDLDLKSMAELKIEREGALAKLGGFRTQIAEKLPDWIAWYFSYQAADETDRATMIDQYRAMRGKVIAALGVANPIVKAEVAVLYAAAVLESVPREWDALRPVVQAEAGDESHLPGLITVGILVETDHEGGDTFVVGPKAHPTYYRFLAERSDAVALAKLAREVVGEIRKGDVSRHRDQLETLRANAEATCTVSLVDLYTGTAGRVHAITPEGSYPKRDRATGRTEDIRLPGGEVILQSDGRVYRAVEVGGPFANMMADVVESGTFLAISWLRYPRLDFDKFPGSEKFSPEMRVQMVKLHGIARRALEADKAKRDEAALLPVVLEEEFVKTEKEAGGEA